MRKQMIVAIVIVGIIVIGILAFYLREENGTDVIIHNDLTGVPNPSGAYCRALGYEVEYHETGGSYCILPDKTRCGQWAFYRGECGQEWSYCALKGYGIETRDDGKDLYSIVYSVCIDKQSGEVIGLTSELINAEFKE